VAWLVDHPSRGAPWTEVVVPATAEPGRRLLLGGLPARDAAPAGGEPSETSSASSSDGSVTLAVAVRGDEDARVDVTMLTEQGPVTPAGAGGRLFTAGSVETVSLRPPGGASFGVVVTVASGGPVTVAAGVPGAASGGLTWVGAVAADGLLTGDPHRDVWVPPLPDGASGSLVLTAPDAAATAWLDGDLLRVPAGRTVTVPLDAAFSGGRLVTVDGLVVAAQQLRPEPTPGEAADGGDVPDNGDVPENTATERLLSSVTALIAAPRLVDVPELVPDPRLGG
jgi:hypothetical protein